MSSKLRAFQEEFLTRIHPGTRESFSGENPIAIQTAGTLGEQEAFQVYTTDYVLRMTEVLGEQFGGCWKVLGDDDFLASCEDYIKAYPSHYKTLSHYGESFPAFLEKKYAPDYGFIGELAAFEWAYQKLFHSKRDEIHLAQENLLEAILVRKEGTFIVSSEVNLMKIFQLKDTDDELTWEDIDQPGIFILYKEGYQVKFARLETIFKEVFDALDMGHHLAQTIETFQEDPRFLDLNQEQWAAFFSAVMKSYKLR